MEEKGVVNSGLSLSDVRDDSLCAMYFGISCALFAVKCLSERQSDDQKCDLLFKLQVAEREIQELKRRRSEDAKANEKVASIYAVQKQSWFTERRKLQRQIGGLLSDFRILDRRKNETIYELNGKLKEMEVSMNSKDKMLEEEEKKRKDLEEKLKSMEAILEEARDKTKREAQDHSSELLKHKTAFIELVSNQRQLEAELGRALKQLEASKEQLEFVFEKKEEALLIIQRLSMEIEKMRKDSEKKDEIVAAMMRKSKLDMTEKQMLLKEVKVKKPKRKKSERETQSWWTIAGSRNERRTLRHLLSRQVSTRLEINRTKMELQNEHEDNSLHLEQRLPEESTNFEAMGLDEWVHLEAEKYQTANDQRHQVDLDACAEKLRVKDDKLEAFRWRLLSTELESKRSKTQIEVLNKDVSQLRHDNSKLEALLLDREEELKTSKDQMAVMSNNFNAQNTNVYQDKREEEEAQSVFSTEVIEEKEVLERDNPTGAVIEVLSPDGLETKGNEVAANKLTYMRKKEKPVGKMDLHALGVSYKIKRLNQQLLMLERLTGKQGSVEVKGKDELGQTKMKAFLLLLSLLSKQVSRYQSLQEKIDGLSQRMSEKDLCGTQIVSSSKRTKEDTKALEHFLDETFQLQRFIVATGQKLMEIHPKIAPEFVRISEELDVSASFDMKRFADTIQTLFKDVQRGLEVRIARIIGDLGGTLTCDGIHSQK